MKPIKLGRKFEPCQPGSICSTKDGENVYFPTLYIETKKPIDLPKAGVLTIRYERCSVSENDKTGASCVSIDVLQILDVKSSAKGDEKLTTEEALDKLRDEVTDGADSEDKDSYVEEDGDDS